MVKLSQLVTAIRAYLGMNGDKEILSVGTVSGSSNIAYSFHLCDIGGTGADGRDTLHITKDGKIAIKGRAQAQPAADDQPGDSRLKVKDLIGNREFDVNANVKVYGGGQWNEDGEPLITFSCGSWQSKYKEAMDSHITYMTVDGKGCIIIECDA